MDHSNDDAFPNLDQGFANWIVTSLGEPVPYITAVQADRRAVPAGDAAKPSWGTTTALSLTVAHQEDEIATLRGMLGLREKQVDDLREEIAVLNRQLDVLRAALLDAQRRDEAEARNAEGGDPDWTAPLSLLPRGMR